MHEKERAGDCREVAKRRAGYSRAARKARRAKRDEGLGAVSGAAFATLLCTRAIAPPYWPHTGELFVYLARY